MIINGPNLNLLGKREPATYGTESFEDFLVKLDLKYEQVQLEYVQSNLEGEIINAIQETKAEGVILNAGGYSHTSVAIRDAVAASDLPIVEVHISNLSSRESFRHDSLLSPVCKGCIVGFGLKGYELAIMYFQDLT